LNCDKIHDGVNVCFENYNKKTTRPSITKILILEPIAMVVGMVENVVVGEREGGEVTGEEEG
jgi:hypothetical protein